MGQISKVNCFLIMGLWKEKKWGGKRLINEFPESDGRRQVLLVCFKKLTTTGQSKGSQTNTIMV